MTLTEFKYIVAVARERHFGRAASSCFVSQPTLSVAVRKLEEELDVTLFERRKSEVTVTAIGKRIIEQAQRILEESDLLKQIASEGIDQLADPIKLGALTTIGQYLLPKLILTTHRSQSRLRIIPEENSKLVLQNRLKKGELDVVIVSEPFSEPGIETTPLYEEPFLLVLPIGHPWSNRKHIPFSELRLESLLMLSRNHCLRDQIMSFFPTLRTKSESPSLETIRHMVASNLGISIFPKYAINMGSYADNLLTSCELIEPSPSRRILLAWRKSFTRPGAILELVSLVKQSVAEKLKDSESNKIPVVGA